jgi:hypothetical protein
MFLSIRRSKRKTKIYTTITICFVLIVVTIFLILFRQRIIDQITVWGYSPSSQATSLVQRAGMNDNGIFYYYASQPSLYNPSTSSDFNKVCNNTEKTTAILGCYSGNKIYIYVVEDKQLDGISEVTAVHETMHAIYNRLTDSEKTRINKLLENEYSLLSGNKYYADLLAFYSSYEPGQRDNELHSIIGTEVAQLDPELESYYSQYFSNRQEVVNLDVKYSTVFKTLKDKADKLSAEIDNLSVSISVRSNQYNADAQKLNSDITTFNERAQNGGFTTQSQFNNERAVLTNRAAELENRRLTIQSDIKYYQSQVAQYNSIATESKKLYDTINSSLVSSPSV